MGKVSKAQTTWTGDLAHGSGTTTGATGAFRELPINWRSRTEAPAAQTSPEELLAAAHASCFAMALSHGLAKNGTPPELLKVEAEVSFEQVDGAWKVATSALTVHGRVPGIDSASFERAAEEAKEGCPVSLALRGNVRLSVRAILEGAVTSARS